MVDLPLTLLPGTVLRLGVPEDLEALRELDAKKPEGGRVTSKAVLQYRLENEVCLVLQQGKGIIAYAVFILEGERCEAVKLVSLDSGLSLLQTAIKQTTEWLKSRGITKLVSRCRKELVPLYKRFGFKESGILPHFFGFNSHAIAIELNL